MIPMKNCQNNTAVDNHSQPKAPNQNRLNSNTLVGTVPISSMSILVIPPQNQVTDEKGNKIVFLDFFGNQVIRPVAGQQCPTPITPLPIVQGASNNLTLLMMNNQDACPDANRSETVDSKETVTAPKNTKPIPATMNALPDDVVFVNPKQYKRILIRRNQRYKLQVQGKIPFSSERKKYLHESRHLHAKKRHRESDGRFQLSSPVKDE